MLTTALFIVALAGPAVDIPLKGTAPSQPVLGELARVPGVERIDVEGATLRLEVEAGKEVRLRQLEQVLTRRARGTTIDQDRLAITPQTIFELNAGQCFFCAEGPLGQTLGRKAFVKTWTVVDYAPKGRLRFRIEPTETVALEALGSDGIEDIVFTARYDGEGELNLYWPTGGVSWRPDEQTARREATASRKPLMIFPTAGT